MHHLALPVPELDDWLESGRPRERAGRGRRGGAGARPILAVRSELPARYQFNGPFPAGPPETGGANRSESERASGPAVSEHNRRARHYGRSQTGAGLIELSGQPLRMRNHKSWTRRVRLGSTPGTAHSTLPT